MSRLTLVLYAITLSACWEVAGANTQESVRGNADGGNLVGEQLIVARDGRHLIAAGPDGHGVYSVDLVTFASVPLDLSVDARRMAFADDDSAYFAGIAKDGIGGVIERVSLTTGKATARWPVPIAMDSISYDEATGRLALWTLFRSEIFVVDPRKKDHLDTIDLERSLIDVRWLPNGDLAAVKWHEFVGDDPSTDIVLIAPNFHRRVVTVPNCSSRLVLSPTGGPRMLAMLAPNACTKDPVSLIDLARGEFIENLPGFGPVAFSPDGETAIAFGRQDDLENVGIDTGTPYSLLFISMRDRSVDTLDIGDAVPVYSLTPDGQVVLVYSVFDSASYDGIFLIDLATRTIRETSGPDVALSEYVVTPDSRLVYLIQGGLFRLDVRSGAIEYLTLGCGGIGEPTRCNPELVNLLPDGDTLVLGWRQTPEYALFDIPTEAITRTFVVGSRAASPPLSN